MGLHVAGQIPVVTKPAVQLPLRRDWQTRTLISQLCIVFRDPVAIKINADSAVEVGHCYQADVVLQLCIVIADARAPAQAWHQTQIKIALDTIDAGIAGVADLGETIFPEEGQLNIFPVLVVDREVEVRSAAEA